MPLRVARLLRTVLTALVLAVMLVQPAGAETAGGANHVVMATTTVDGGWLARAGLQMAPVGSDTVDSTNLARAQARDCSACRSVAVAVQAVFITSEASTVTPTNAAVATNVNCSGCSSLAFAYQYVLSTDGPVYLGGAAAQQLADLRARFAEASGAGLPFDDLRDRLDALVAEFRRLIDEELVRAGQPGGGAVSEQVSVAPTA
jgi:hypothetical protein